MQRQQQSQQTKVDHHPWNDASISTKTNDPVSLFGKRGRGDFQEPRSCVYAVPVTEDTHALILSGVYYTMPESLTSIITHRSIPAR